MNEHFEDLLYDFSIDLNQFALLGQLKAIRLFQDQYLLLQHLKHLSAKELREEEEHAKNINLF